MNKNNCLLYAFLSLLPINLSGQIENFYDYQNHINQAELNLVRGEKENALNIYYTILTTAQGNFCKDIYNAMVLSTELSKTDTFFIFLDMLLPKGLSNEYINNNEEFTLYHGLPEWKEFLEKNKNHPNINLSLKEKTDSLFIKDQYFRKMEGSYKLYIDTIHYIDSINMEFLFDLIASDHFPGEDDIGVNTFSGDLGYDIVFHHYTQQSSLNTSLNKITPILVNLVLEGKIMPNKAALWIEYQGIDFTTGVFNVMGVTVDNEKKGFFVPEYNKKEKLIINQYRQWLGMETIEEYYEKFIFKMVGEANNYIFDIRVGYFDMNEEMFSKMTANMTQLK